jgi:hypothetical protein
MRLEFSSEILLRFISVVPDVHWLFSEGKDASQLVAVPALHPVLEDLHNIGVRPDREAKLIGTPRNNGRVKACLSRPCLARHRPGANHLLFAAHHGDPQGKVSGMAVWRKRLFAAMHLNANLPAADFGVPTSQVGIEVGIEVEI